MKITFYGSSILSSYWNGAATYYRGLLCALAAHGHDITFYEPDAFGRQQNRDIDPPEWCRVVVYGATPDGLRNAARQAQEADVVVKTSGVGYEDDVLLRSVLDAAAPVALKVFWDVDAPATLAELRTHPDHPTQAALADLDLVLTYGGGDAVVAAYRELGAVDCIPIYNALDPATHHPVAVDSRFDAACGFLGAARGELLGVDPAKIDRIDHQRREAGIAHGVGDDAAGEGEQQARRFGIEEGVALLLGHVAHAHQAAIGEVDDIHRAAL